MRIESIEIKNYRVFRDARFENLAPLTLLVGANGSGKSTLLDAFELLKDCIQHNVTEAVARRGGFKELVSRGEEGPIEVSIEFRDDFNRLGTYTIAIEAYGTAPRVHRESLRIRRDTSDEVFPLLSFNWGIGTATPWRHEHDSDIDTTINVTL